MLTLQKHKLQEDKTSNRLQTPPEQSVNKFPNISGFYCQFCCNTYR